MKKSKNRGQSLVEFALVLPFLILVALGMLDLGRAFFTVITVTNASRVGVRYLTRNPDDAELNTDCDGLEMHYCGTYLATIQEADGSFINLSFSDINPNCTGNPCESDTAAQVTVRSDFQLLFLDAILGWALPDPFYISRTTRMVVP